MKTIKQKANSRGQGTIEFTFGLAVVLLLIFGVIKAGSWVMIDPTERRIQHEQSLFRNSVTHANGETKAIDAGEQLNPYFHQTHQLDMEPRRKD